MSDKRREEARTGHYRNEYPSSAFPNLQAWRMNKKDDIGLNGYGSWEAVDFRFEEGRQTSYAKKSRPTSLMQNDDSIILAPQQDPVLLCHSELKNGSLPISDDFPLKLKTKIINRRKKFTTIPVENKFLDFVDGFSQVCTEDFEKFLRRNRLDASLHRWMRKSLNRFDATKFLRHFDPTCFWVGKKTLSELLQEGYKASISDDSNEQRAVGTGCLSYADVKKHADGKLGILIVAQNPGMDELCIKSVLTATDKESSFMDEPSNRNLEIQSCGEIVQTLNGRILNVDHAPFDGNIMIIAMSDYHVLINNFHSTDIILDKTESVAEFSENALTSPYVLKSTDGRSSFSSATLNPFIQGECVVATTGMHGVAGLWTPEKHSSDDISSAILRLNITFDGDDINLKHICFAAHPRQFYSCDGNSVYVFDIRSQSSPQRLFCSDASKFLKQSEHLHSVQSCRSISNEYEILVASDNNLILFDQRHSFEPLLHWSVPSKFPACYAKPLSSSLQDGQFSNHVILSGGLTTDEVYYSQINRSCNLFNHPPCLIAPPRLLSPLHSVVLPNDLSTKVEQCVPSYKNKYVVNGFDGTIFENRISNCICIFQLTSLGTVAYQILNRYSHAGHPSFHNFPYGHSTSLENELNTEEVDDFENIGSFHKPSGAIVKHLDYYSDRYDRFSCAICKLGGFENADSDNENEPQVLSIHSSLCKHGHVESTGTMTYDVKDVYFHDDGEIPDLKLIDLSKSEDQSGIGKGLIMSDICSVSQLVHPCEDEITVCERNGKLITVNDSSLVDAYMEGEVTTFPSVHICSDSLRRTGIIPGESAKAAFLEHKETMGQRLLCAWHENGIIGILTEICSDECKDHVSPILKKFCYYTLVSVRWVTGMHFTLFPHLKLSQTELISNFSVNRDWENSPIRYVSWHQRTNKLAVALRDDTVKIYYSTKDSVSILRHKLQKNITCMEWRPFLSTHLAVGTQTAILIWFIDPKSHSTRPSSGAIQVLSYKGLSPVTSLAWCPTGDDILLATSAFSSALVVWSTAVEECQVIQHLTTNGGISHVFWSPDGSKVLVTTPSSSFRVFETGMWTNERWSNLSGYVQCACWNPGGSMLLFALYGDSHVYSVEFPDSQLEGPSLAGCSHASVVLDLTPNEDDTLGSNCIHSMTWDDTGRRVAITFGEADRRGSLVALFSTSYDPVFRIAPVGYVQGVNGVEPMLICFKPNYDLGSCLTVCWSDGSITYLPLYLPSLDGKRLKFQRNKVLTDTKSNTSRFGSSLWSRGVESKSSFTDG